MVTTVTSIANISNNATGGGSDTLQITSGVVASGSLTAITGYTAVEVNTNGAHVIVVPAAIVSTANTTVTFSTTSTISVSINAAGLTGTSTKVTLISSDGADSLTGGPAADSINGGNSDDLIYGGSGSAADTLVGAAGVDTLSGGQGNDLVSGGTQGDLIYGNLG
ncbi:MAG: hypothetical protein VW057_07275, partial [Rhodospirillaceae bacterium]